MISSYIPGAMHAKRNKRKWIFILKVIFSLGVIAYVLWKVRKGKLVHGEEFSLWSIATDFGAAKLAFFVPAVLLVVLNIGLEASKWQILIRKYYRVNIITAVQAVLCGMAIGILTPNRVGEYGGRAFFLKHGKRAEVIAVTFIDRVGQMIITLLAGIAGMIFYLNLPEVSGKAWNYPAPATLLWSAVGLLVVVVVGYLLFGKRLKKKKLSGKGFFIRVRIALAEIRFQTIVAVLALSALRYVVFSSQYVLLMYSFGFSGNTLAAFGAVSVVFLIKSVIPFIAFTEVGVREGVAIEVMEGLGWATMMIFSSSLTLYGINILVPTLIGALLVYKLKLEERKEGTS